MIEEKNINTNEEEDSITIMSPNMDFLKKNIEDMTEVEAYMYMIFRWKHKLYNDDI